jgi:hypothetical protein
MTFSQLTFPRERDLKISRKLHLVIPLERDEGDLYIHSTPIGMPVFERYHMVLSKAFATIYTQGLSWVAGPRVAAMVLKNVAEGMGVWAGVDGVENGLMAEIKRLTNLFAPAPDGAGWRMIPLDDALDREMMDEDEASEVTNALAFFTVAWHMHSHQDRENVMSGAVKLWGGQLSSLNATDFMSSLPTSTLAESTGGKATASSMPT